MSDKIKEFDSVVFDLDGVITRTAAVHSRAWKMTFDEYLKLRSQRDNEPFREFTHQGDYLPFVDGKPRYEGVKSFLESRGIDLAMGDPFDPADKETVCGIGNRKNQLVLKLLREKGVEVYQATVDFIRELKKHGVRVGVASSSKNCQEILQAADIESLFETRVDGVVSAELGLKGKPEGDIFVRAARDLGALPGRSIIVEDAISGVQAGRNGCFGLVIGVARHDNQQELLDNGADVAVTDFADVDLEWCRAWFHKQPQPLYQSWEKEVIFEKQLIKKGIKINPAYNRPASAAIFSSDKIVFFLDYDGTLTPIVSRPDLALLSREMKDVLISLSQRYSVAVVSGRMRQDVEKLVDIKGLIYAGSHGFDIAGPDMNMVHPGVKDIIPAVDQATALFKDKLASFSGVLIEEKKFSVAVHYRLAGDEALPVIKKCVDQAVKKDDRLRLMHGKKVFEILPAIDWNKGKAVRWLMEALNFSWEGVSVIYIGDDTTDEDAFRAVRGRGTSILVGEVKDGSAADFQLSSPQQVREFFEKVMTARK